MNIDINEYLNAALRLIGLAELTKHFQALEIARLEDEVKKLLDENLTLKNPPQEESNNG